MLNLNNIKAGFPASWELYLESKKETLFYPHLLFEIYHNPIVRNYFSTIYKGEENIPTKTESAKEIGAHFRNFLKPSKEKLPEIQERFGVDYNSLVEIVNEFVSYVDKKDLLSDIENKYDLNCTGLCSYAPIISFLKPLIKSSEDFKILEIGTDYTGLGSLSYLNSLGAKTFALDTVELDANIVKKSGAIMVNGRWENLTEYFQKNFFDVIYFNFMPPQPWKGGKLDSPNLTLKESEEKFESQIKTDMDSLLKNNGIIVQREVNLILRFEYILENMLEYNKIQVPINNIVQNSLEGNDFYFFSKNQNKKRLRETLTLPLNPNEVKIYFGQSLNIFQKPSI